MDFRYLVSIDCSLENFLACYYHELCEDPTFLPTVFDPILILIQEGLFRVSCCLHAKLFFLLDCFDVGRHEKELVQIVDNFFEVVEIGHSLLIEKVEYLEDPS